MRNLAEKWAVLPDWQTVAIERPTLKLRALAGLNQYLVSGNLDAWSKASGMAAQGVGAFGRAEGDSYTAQVARDRLLAIARFPLAVVAGWHAEGFAVTEVSAGLHVFQAEGAGVEDFIARATPLDPRTNGACAALSFAHVNAIVYRHGETLRIHIDRSLAAYLWSWMEIAAPSEARSAC